MTQACSLEEIEARLRSVPETLVVSADDLRAITQLARLQVYGTSRSQPHTGQRSAIATRLQMRAGEPNRDQWIQAAIATLLAVAIVGGIVAAGNTLRSRTNGGMASATSPLPASIPINVQVSNDRFRITTSAEMCRTLLVAEGVVVSYGPSRWNTSDGTRPAGLTETALVRQGYAIETPVFLGSTVVDHDRRSTSTTQLVVVGGAAGADTWRDSSFPRPQAGTRIVGVFVPAQRPAGTFSQSTLELFEAFPITGDVVTLLPQTVEQGQVSQAAVTIRLADLRKALASC